MEGIVRRIDREGPSVDRQPGSRLKPLCADGILRGPGLSETGPVIAWNFTSAAGANGKFPVLHQQAVSGAEAIASGGDIKPAVPNKEEPKLAVVVVFRVDAVLAGYNGVASVGDPDTVLTADAMLLGTDGIAAAGKHQVILGDNSVSCLGLDRQAPGAIQGQIRFGKDDRIDAVAVYVGVLPSVCQTVLRVRSRGKKHLIRLPDIDCRRSGAADVRAVQHQLDLIRVLCVNHNHSVIQRAGEDINAFLRDGYGSLRDQHPLGIAGGAAAGQQDPRSRFFVIADLQIPVCEHFRNVFRRRLLRRSAGRNGPHIRRGVRGTSAKQHAKDQQSRGKRPFFHMDPPFL